MMKLGQATSPVLEIRLSLENAKDFAMIGGVAVALGALIKALVEYSSVVLRRVEHFTRLRDEFLKDDATRSAN